MLDEPPDTQQRLSYMNLQAADCELLEALRPILERHAAGFVAAFYRNLLSFGPTRELLRDPEVKDRLLIKQRDYLLSLASPTLDEAFVAQRKRIGEIHQKIGLEPRWYLGAYALYFSLLAPLVAETSTSRPSGASVATCSRTAAMSNGTYGRRSIFVTTVTAAFAKIAGYLNGLSSPSVTDRRTILKSSPRS